MVIGELVSETSITNTSYRDNARRQCKIITNKDVVSFLVFYVSLSGFGLNFI